jgi:hypothetical protein
VAIIKCISREDWSWRRGRREPGSAELLNERHGCKAQGVASEGWAEGREREKEESVESRPTVELREVKRKQDGSESDCRDGRKTGRGDGA